MDTNKFFNLIRPDSAINAGAPEGMIVKKQAGGYLVQTATELIQCELAGRMWKEPERERAGRRRPSKIDPDDADGDAPVVGDRVRWKPRPGGGGVIIERLPRRSRLARRAASGSERRHAAEQVIAANVDQIVAVLAAALPAPKWNLLDRYLAAAESSDLPALVCITKSDLDPDGDGLEAEMQVYRRIGYEVLITSAVSGEGIAALRSALAGRLSVLVGKSGVGKTSLLNALQPGLGGRVSAVSAATGKGRHTTTALEMFALEGGGALIDTPGMREFGLWGVSGEELIELFPEMRPLVGSCRFGLDCRHDEEPGCAVRRAVTGGAVSPRRYQSYLRLAEEMRGSNGRPD